jgi:hypothetical protein
MSVWARWRQPEIHHMDLDAGYTHSHWPAEFVDLMLLRVLPTLAALADEITVQVQVTDRHLAETDAAAATADDLVVICGSASAVLCWPPGIMSAWKLYPSPPSCPGNQCHQRWRRAPYRHFCALEQIVAKSVEAAPNGGYLRAGLRPAHVVERDPLVIPCGLDRRIFGQCWPYGSFGCHVQITR